MEKRLQGRSRLLPGWTDTEQFRPVKDRSSLKRQLGWRVDIPVMFTLRRLAPRMGLDRLVEAAAILAKKGIDFQIMVGGEGEQRASLEARARALGVSDNVVFIGYVEDQQLPLCYAACDAFVLPTAELECFGLIALGGRDLAAGRPVHWARR